MGACIEYSSAVLHVARSSVIVHTLVLLMYHFLDAALGQVIDRAHVLLWVGRLGDDCDRLVVSVLCADRVASFDFDVRCILSFHLQLLLVLLVADGGRRSQMDPCLAASLVCIDHDVLASNSQVLRLLASAVQTSRVVVVGATITDI